ATLGGYPVTSIGDYAFQECSEITSIKIPDDVTKIGKGAFSYCRGLTSMTIPEGVNNIEYATFLGCLALSSVTIPNSITNIEQNAFHTCTLLKSVTIPDSVIRIGNSAFNSCSELKSVTIPDSVTSIGNYAFYNCRGLLSVTIGNGVTEIGSFVGSYLFTGCSSLNTIYLPASYSRSTNEWGLNDVAISRYVLVYFDENKGTFAGEKPIKRIVLNSTYGEMPIVTRPGYKFSGWMTESETITAHSICRKIENHTLTAGWIPNKYVISFDASGGDVMPTSKTVTFDVPYGELPIPKCEPYIFLDWQLNGFSIHPATIVSTEFNHALVARWEICIGNGFWEVIICDDPISLGEPLVAPTGNVDIPDEISSRPVVAICDRAFYNNENITSITIPNAVTSICNNAFFGCNGLKAFSVAGANPFFSSINEMLLSKDGSILICGVNGNVSIPNSVTSIGSAAFKDFGGLTAVMIPDTVTSIGNDAFSGCSGLTSVTIPDSVTNIGNDAFSGCSGLTSVIIPEYLYSWSDKLLSGNNATIILKAANGELFQDYLTFSDSALPIGQVGKKYRIKIVANTISHPNLKYSCSSLPNGISLSDDGWLTGIPREAVENRFVTISTDDGRCHTFSLTIHPIGYGWQTSGIWKYEVENNEAIIRRCTQTSGSIKVPESLGGYSVRTIEAPHIAAYDDFGSMTNIYIPAVVFESGISSITLPSNLRNLGVGAVAASSISSLTVPNGVTNVGAYAATLCRGLRNIQFGSGVRSIGDAAFTDCTALQSASIPSTVHELGIGIFERCSGLLSASVFSDCGFLPSSTFKDCAALQSVNLASSITNVQSLAFAGCSQLQGIGLPDGVREIGFGAFANCVSLDAFSCPENLERIMGSCFLGCTTLSGISLNGNLASIWTNAFANCTSLQEISI
ncbi:MAG: leucine-rich repeat protein, partial [Bacteroidales bacterium]|nr:leucine-rich repeat protein [Bacteroidales bacterium]